MFNTQKVVRCSGCNKYFGYTEKSTKCPFCHTEHDGKVEEKSPDLSAQAGKKGTTKTPKKSFKIWRDS